MNSSFDLGFDRYYLFVHVWSVYIIKVKEGVTFLVLVIYFVCGNIDFSLNTKWFEFLWEHFGPWLFR